VVYKIFKEDDVVIHDLRLSGYYFEFESNLVI